MQIAPLSPIVTPAAQLTAAEQYIRNAAWLVAPGSVVLSLEALDELTVRVLVSDPFALDPHDRVEADRLAADSARVVLEQTGHGVELLTVTSLGYIGRIRELAPAQLTFLTGLPGVQRYDLEPHDSNGDGKLVPGEFAHTVEVDSNEDAARIGWLLRDRFDHGSIHDGPVVVQVPVQPWQPAPVRGARDAS
jgi:hypothetical protein